MPGWACSCGLWLAAESFCLWKLFPYHYFLICCAFCLILGALESDCMHADSVHIKHEIWPLIHFIEKWVHFYSWWNMWRGSTVLGCILISIELLHNVLNALHQQFVFGLVLQSLWPWSWRPIWGCMLWNTNARDSEYYGLCQWRIITISAVHSGFPLPSLLFGFMHGFSYYRGVCNSHISLNGLWILVWHCMTG